MQRRQALATFSLSAYRPMQNLQASCRKEKSSHCSQAAGPAGTAVGIHQRKMSIPAGAIRQAFTAKDGLEWTHQMCLSDRWRWQNEGHLQQVKAMAAGKPGDWEIKGIFRLSLWCSRGTTRHAGLRDLESSLCNGGFPGPLGRRGRLRKVLFPSQVFTLCKGRLLP